MRTLHRWLASVGALLFIYLTISGTLLAVAEYRTGPTIIGAGGGGPPGMGAPPAAGATPTMGAEPAPGGLVRLFKDLHSGGVAGKAGEWLVFATGVGCVVLSVTGLVLYVQMYRQRRRRGDATWFWR